MTWLPVNGNAANERDAVLGLHSEAYEHHRAFLDACAGAIDPDLLELCRARMAQTFRCREELARHSAQRLAQAGSRQKAPDLTAVQRNALAFVDQFILDPALISQELAGALEEALGTSGVINFTTAISAFEASIRLSALLELEPTA